MGGSRARRTERILSGPERSIGSGHCLTAIQLLRKCGRFLIKSAAALMTERARTVAACLAGWLLLTLLIIYVPVMIGALSDPNIEVQVEGINYFADTLLFTGVILALASAGPRAGMEREQMEQAGFSAGRA
jgi:hypothetical protein